MILMLVISILIPSLVRAENDIRVRIEYINMDGLHQIIPATNTIVKSGVATILYPPEIDGYYTVTKGVEVTLTST